MRIHIIKILNQTIENVKGDSSVILGRPSSWLMLPNSHFWDSSQIPILARSIPHSELQGFRNWKIVSSHKKCWGTSGKSLKCNAMENASDTESEILYLILHFNAYCLTLDKLFACSDGKLTRRWIQIHFITYTLCDLDKLFFFSEPCFLYALKY